MFPCSTNCTGRPNPRPPNAERMIANARTSGIACSLPVTSFIKSKVERVRLSQSAAPTMAIPAEPPNPGVRTKTRFTSPVSK